MVDEPKIAKLQRNDVKNDTLLTIRAILVKMVKDMHVDNGLTNDNIREISKRLTTDSEIRWWLTLADVSLLCRRIAEGAYGHFFGHFSVIEFNECLGKYCRERNEAHAMQAEKNTTAVQEKVAVDTMRELGYRIDNNGRLVNIKQTGEHKPEVPRFIYDENGKPRDNPAFWQRKNMTIKTKQLMEEDRALNYRQALVKVAEMQEKLKSEEQPIGTKLQKAVEGIIDKPKENKE